MNEIMSIFEHVLSIIDDEKAKNELKLVRAFLLQQERSLDFAVHKLNKLKQLEK